MVNDNVILIKGVPHEWLFPQCAVVIHHGGAGSVGASMRAGVPTICYPLLGDQFYWGAQLGRLGFGPPQVFKLKELTAENLKTQIKSCLEAKTVGIAKTAGSDIRKEDGLNYAIDLIEFYRRSLGNTGVALDWEADGKVQRCPGEKCGSAEFSFTHRRSHCRVCGKIQCRTCLQSCYVPNYLGPQPVCSACNERRKQYSEKFGVDGWGSNCGALPRTTGRAVPPKPKPLSSEQSSFPFFSSSSSSSSSSSTSTSTSSSTPNSDSSSLTTTSDPSTSVTPSITSDTLETTGSTNSTSITNTTSDTTPSTISDTT